MDCSVGFGFYTDPNSAPKPRYRKRDKKEKDKKEVTTLPSPPTRIRQCKGTMFTTTHGQPELEALEAGGETTRMRVVGVEHPSRLRQIVTKVRWIQLR